MQAPICPVCERLFRYTQHVQYHLIEDHPEENYYPTENLYETMERLEKSLTTRLSKSEYVEKEREYRDRYMSGDLETPIKSPAYDAGEKVWRAFNAIRGS